MPIWKTCLLRLIALARRYPGTIAAFGFVSGIVSFFTVERHEGFARGIALVMLVSWVWLVVEQALRQRLSERFGLTIPIPVLRYVTQMIHQEGLFFVLPFLYTATTWNSGQALFTGLIGLAALVALVDPLYYRWLGARRWVFLTYHTVTLFAVLLTALPLILHIRTGHSYQLALGVAVLLSFPTLSELIAIDTRWRKWLVAALMLGLAALGWAARLWVPPATLWLTQVAISTRIDDRSMAAGDSLRVATPEQMRANGLYAYTAINAPLGLKEHIYHVWLHDGREVDRIALDIRGGRKEGYRAWTHKQNFPADPSGHWQVKVVTDAGQMIGTLRFRVAAAAAAAPERSARLRTIRLRTIHKVAAVPSGAPAARGSGLMQPGPRRGPPMRTRPGAPVPDEIMPRYPAPAAVLAACLLAACGAKDTAGPAAGPPPQSLQDLERQGALPRLDRSADLGGPDADGNGIRDDIDLWIAAQPVSDPARGALRQLARSFQSAVLVDAADRAAVSRVSAQHMRAVTCVMASNSSPVAGSRAVADLRKLTANTRPRVQAYLAYSAALDGASFGLPPASSSCDS